MEEEKVIRDEEVREEERGASIGTWASLGIVWAVIFGAFILLFVVYLGRI